MKLVEFHIGHPASGAPGHSDAVAASAVRIAGVEIRFAGPPGCEHYGAGLEQFHPFVALVQDIGPLAALAAHHKIYRHAVGENLYIAGCGSTLREYLGNRTARAIRGMDNATVAVSALHGQVEFAVFRPGLVLPQVKVHALRHQPLNAASAVAHGELYCFTGAQPRAGLQRV